MTEEEAQRLAQTVQGEAQYIGVWRLVADEDIREHRLANGEWCVRVNLHSQGYVYVWSAADWYRYKKAVA